MRIAPALLVSAVSAAGDPVDVFGFGPRGAAMGGAFTALSDDATASMYNPAGSALARDPMLMLGYGAGLMDLEIDGEGAGVNNAHALSMALGFPFRVGGVDFGTSFALYLPDQFAVRLYVLPPEQPRFLMLDNDPHRIVFAPSLSVRPLGWLAAGGGVTLLGDAAGSGITFDLSSRGGEAAGDSSLDVELPTRAAPVAGVLVMPTDRLRLGASWRGAIDLAIRIDVVSNVEFSGVVEGDSTVSVRAVNFYTPHRVSAGAAYALTGRTTVAADATYLRWSDYKGDTIDLQTLVDLSTAPPLVLTSVPRQRFRDVVVPRAGFEHRRAHGPRLASGWRGGAYFERSPVPDQTGFTSYADNDRVVVTLGAGLTLVPTGGGVLIKPMSLDATFQYQQLLPREVQKDDVSGPGSDFSSGGRIVHGSLVWTVKF